MNDLALALVVIAFIVAWNYGNWLDRVYPEFATCQEYPHLKKCEDKRK